MTNRAEPRGFASRLRTLIERDFAGNLNRAAKSWGVAQPTLHRYVHGATEAPRARSLQRIAAFYGTTIEWLLDEVGDGPIEPERPIVQYREWDALVDSLKLPDEDAALVRALPSNIGHASFTLCDWGFGQKWEKRISLERMEPALRGKWLAQIYELEAWTTWLRGMIEAYGRQAVQQKLISLRDRLRLGFQPFACFLLDDLLKQNLTAAYRGFWPPESNLPTPPTSVMRSLPPTAPLNALRGRQPIDHPRAQKGRPHQEDSPRRLQVALTRGYPAVMPVNDQRIEPYVRSGDQARARVGTPAAPA